MEEIVEEVVTSNLGLISLIPVAVLFTVSVITKRTLFAMFCSVVVGVLILAGGIVEFPKLFFGYLYESLSDESCQWILLIIAGFGIFTTLVERSGAIGEFGRCIERFMKTQRQILFGTFIFGLVVFVDDYLSNMTVGTIMRKMTDSHRIPRTQLAYIINLMAGPICLLIPFSSWTAAFTGVFASNGILKNGSAAVAFISSIPLIFYAWVALIICLLQIFGIIPKMGMIKRDYIRAAETGDVFPKGGRGPSFSVPEPAEALPEGNSAAPKPQPWNFLVPLIVIVVVTFLSDLDVLFGCGAGCLVAFFLYLFQKKLRFKELLDVCVEGVMRQSFLYILFVLAWAIMSINNGTGMPEFVISLVQPLMNGRFLPVVAFVVCAVYAFFTGACWDLALIIMPIVIPLAIAYGVDPILAAAAVYSGSLFGNVVCPYGDGVILCAQASEIRPIDLTFAIAPYMVMAGVITAILYAIVGFFL
jgi:Na+/H+ antiporter NhaC